MLCTKIFVIERSVFDQNYTKNGEYNNIEIIRRKKNTNMNKERRKLKAIINNHQGQNSKIQSTHLIIRTIIS